MSKEAKVYTSLPVDIHATQWDGTHSDAVRVLEWIVANSDLGETAAYFLETNETKDRLNPLIMIETLEGVIGASPGDWLIQGTSGEFYPCKPDVFMMKYK